MEIQVFCDGSYIENKDHGGYGIVIKNNEEDIIASRGYKHTTGNRMELIAVIIAIKMIKKINLKAMIYSDSKYVVNAINNGWLKNWAKNNWKRSNNKELKNKDLWQKLWSLIFLSEFKIEWIKSHNNNINHDKAHALAYSAAQGKKFWRDKK